MGNELLAALEMKEAGVSFHLRLEHKHDLKELKKKI